MLRTNMTTNLNPPAYYPEYEALYERAKAAILDSRRASTSMLQRMNRDVQPTLNDLHGGGLDS